jgi:hypothetical protein
LRNPRCLPYDAQRSRFAAPREARSAESKASVNNALLGVIVVKEAATHPAIRGLERRDIQHPRQRFLDAPAHFARQGPKVSEPQDQEQVEPPQCEWTYDHHDPDKYPKWIYFSGQWEVQPVKKRQ